MFIDASVLVAIFNQEPDASDLEDEIIDCAARKYVSPMVKFEACTALARTSWLRAGPKGKSRGALLTEARAAIDSYLQELGITEISVTSETGVLAAEAAATFGRYVGHKANLNFGDCFSYACAKTLGVPLLYKGNDFSETDLA
jgi:ribonuclease VapC